VELLKAAARQKLAAGQGELELGLATGAPGGPLLASDPGYGRADLVLPSLTALDETALRLLGVSPDAPIGVGDNPESASMTCPAKG
jgi:hypothetical protein